MVDLKRKVRRRTLRALGVDPRPWPRSVVLPVPPMPAAGEETGPPDFIGVGVQKAGTSWWFDLLVDHPGIDAPPFKELHYFDQLFGPSTAHEAGRYQDYFPRTAGRITGEWTPRYIADPWVPGLLAEAAPEAKILVMLRDPLDRFQSGVTHDMARGAPDNAIVVTDHVQRSDYVTQLRNLFASFDRDQVLVQQYEACRADVAEQLARTHRFLGLDVVAAVNPDRRVNATTVDKSPIPDHVATPLLRRFAEMREPLLELVPDLDLSLWPSMTARDEVPSSLQP